MIVNPALPRAIPAPVVIPLRDLLPWAIFVGFVMLFLLYIVGLEQGAMALIGGEGVHEWVHDARHLLSFPCH